MIDGKPGQVCADEAAWNLASGCQAVTRRVNTGENAHPTAVTEWNPMADVYCLVKLKIVAPSVETLERGSDWQIAINLPLASWPLATSNGNGKSKNKGNGKRQEQLQNLLPLIHGKGGADFH